MKLEKSIFFFVAMSVVIVSACADDDKPKYITSTDKGTEQEDAGEPVDTETDTSTGTEPDETPPETPANCSLVVSQTDVEGRGDSHRAKIEPAGPSASNLLATWAYFGPDATDRWEIVAAPYRSFQMDAGVDAGDSIEGDFAFEPIRSVGIPGPVAEDPAIAYLNGEYGIVWRDGRWDAACPAKNFNDCYRELAFLRVDLNGNPVAGSAPLQLTIDANIELPPAFVATEEGYIAAWIAPESNTRQIVALPVGADGAADATQQKKISGDINVDNVSDVVLASSDNLVLAVWASALQDAIYLTKLDSNANPLGEPQIIDQGSHSVNPVIVAGSDGFMVAWSRYFEKDHEIFTLALDASGAPLNEPRRTTWTVSDASKPKLAWSGSSYALAWLSEHDNGVQECSVETCTEQVFATQIDTNGVWLSDPVQVSDDPNDSRDISLAWDGNGWVFLFEVRRNKRWQMSRARVVCN